MLKTAGVGTFEQQLRAAGLMGPGRLRLRRRSVPPPVVPAQETEQETEESRQARRKAELLARVAPRGIAGLASDLKELGMTLRVVDSKPAGVGPLHQAGRAAPPVVPAQESEESRHTRRKAELLARVAPHGIASLERDLNELGMTVARKIGWKPAGVAQDSLYGRGKTLDVDDPQQVEWSPMTGSSEPPVRAAGLPPQPHVRSAHARPASPAEADARAADPPPPTRPPGVEPWQAWCDDEGRLHMPDPVAVDERFRLLTAAEIHERMRAYGSSA